MPNESARLTVVDLKSFFDLCLFILHIVV